MQVGSEPLQLPLFRHVLVERSHQCVASNKLIWGNSSSSCGRHIHSYNCGWSCESLTDWNGNTTSGVQKCGQTGLGKRAVESVIVVSDGFGLSSSVKCHCHSCEYIAQISYITVKHIYQIFLCQTNLHFILYTCLYFYNVWKIYIWGRSKVVWLYWLAHSLDKR